MVMALVGHSSAQMPHPLQYSRLIVGGIVREMTISGQNSQQMKQASVIPFAGDTEALIQYRPLHPP